MAEPTTGVLDAANHGGTYTWPLNGQNFPRVQVITVKDLLAGKRQQMPTALLPYIQAARAPTMGATQLPAGYPMPSIAAKWGFILTGPDTGKGWPLERPPSCLRPPPPACSPPATSGTAQ
jgi:hypothetical protein